VLKGTKLQLAEESSDNKATLYYQFWHNSRQTLKLQPLRKALPDQVETESSEQAQQVQGLRRYYSNHPSNKKLVNPEQQNLELIGSQPKVRLSSGRESAAGS